VSSASRLAGREPLIAVRAALKVGVLETEYSSIAWLPITPPPPAPTAHAMAARNNQRVNSLKFVTTIEMRPCLAWLCKGVGWTPECGALYKGADS
jgi:hypothetical protein